MFKPRNMSMPTRLLPHQSESDLGALSPAMVDRIADTRIEIVLQSPIPESEAPAPAAPRRRRRWRIPLITALLLVAFFFFVPIPTAHASMFGEENMTLAQMLIQLINANSALRETVNTTNSIVQTARQAYQLEQQVASGVDELKNYTFDDFLADFHSDLDRNTPFGQLEYGSQALMHWDSTRTTSPLSAYQAISAVAGTLSRPLRADVAAGRANVDRQLILANQAAEGFARAQKADKTTDDYDREIAELARLARTASPAQAQQLAARALTLQAAQQSHLLRLNAELVRQSSTQSALQYGQQIADKNAAYQARDLTVGIASQATKPAQMMRFDEVQDPYPSDELRDPYTRDNVRDPYPSPSEVRDPYAEAK